MAGSSRAPPPSPGASTAASQRSDGSSHASSSSSSSLSSSRRRSPPPPPPPRDPRSANNNAGSHRPSPAAAVAGTTPPRSMGGASPPPPPRLRRTAASFDSTGSVSAPLLRGGGEDRSPRQRSPRRERDDASGDVGLAKERLRWEQEALLGDVRANRFSGRIEREGDACCLQASELGRKLDDERSELERTGDGSSGQRKEEEALGPRLYTPKREGRTRRSNGDGTNSATSVYSTTLTTPERAIGSERRGGSSGGRGSPASSASGRSSHSSVSSHGTGDSSRQFNSLPLERLERSSGSGPAPRSVALSGPSLAAVRAADAARHRAQEQHRERTRRMEALLQGLSPDRPEQERKKMMPNAPSRGAAREAAKAAQRSSPRQLRAECEVLIREGSLEGTAAAAAWHLHGQAGRRFGDGGSVMDARALLAMQRNDPNDKGMEVDDIGATADTILSVDTDEGTTRLSAYDVAACDFGMEAAPSKRRHDPWSTGTAAAIVTGTAARYRSAFFAFPHGRRILLPIFTGAAAVALSLVTLLSCQFVTLWPENAIHEGTAFSLGPWRYLSVNPSYSDGEVCLPYPSDMAMDLSFTIARSAAALASGLGIVLFVWTCTLMCVPVSRGSAKGVGVAFVLNGMLQCLTAILYHSERCRPSDDGAGGGYFGRGECRPNQDLVFCIASSALYLATGWIVCMLHKLGGDPGHGSMEVYTWSAEDRSSDPKRGVLRTVEKSWTRVPDGSTVIATVFVERREGAGEREDSVSGGGGGRTKTKYSVQTEILPA